MRPLTVITGIVLGSSLSIAAGLAAVLVIFLVLGDEYPRLQHEFRPLAGSLGIFVALTAISGLSFYWLLIGHRFRFLAQGVLWAAIVGTGYFFWP